MAESARQPETYRFAEEPVGVSSAAACTAKLTKEKKAAVKEYIRTLGPALQQKHGRAPHYAPEQVRDTVIANALSIDYLCWAYLLYCAAPDFDRIHAAAGEICNYGAMREVVAGTFFSGNAAFDAGDVAAALTSGAAEAISAGATESAGWLADVDWSGLMDWS